MKDPIAKLRDRNIKTATFRAEFKEVGIDLVKKLSKLFEERDISADDVSFVSILRSGIVFIDPVLQIFSGSKVGTIGLKRDEGTFIPHRYYENLPPFSGENIIVILDPMLATGGSAEATVGYIAKQGVNPSNIYFLGVVASPEGVARLSKSIPKENIVLAVVDDGLDEHMFIKPGLGDFGDRYFGYEDSVNGPLI